MTWELINEGKTKEGGYTKEQLRLLGINWPPMAGWKNLLIDWDVADEKVKQFIAIGKATYPPPKKPTLAQKQRRLAQKHTVRKRLKEERSPLKTRLGPKEAGVVPSDSWTLTMRERLLNKDNAAEQRIRYLLDSLPVKYEREHPIIIKGQRFFIDFFIVSTATSGRQKTAGVVLEVDGGYHFTKEQREQDRVRDTYLQKCTEVKSILRIGARVAHKISAEDLLYEIINMGRGCTRQMY